MITGRPITETKIQITNDYQLCYSLSSRKTGHKTNLNVFYKERELGFVGINIEEIGLPKKVSLEEIYTRAKEHGFEMLNGGKLFVAVRPPTSTIWGLIQVFFVLQPASGLWKDSCCEIPSDFWHIDSKFLFSRI